ncbi:MAG: RNA-binding S4 domain-containing protein [Verrucomicrobia bacterium]|nr:RNA-binding S4 domain-containing protein [Verrucomicrobiota bacterium]
MDAVRIDKWLWAVRVFKTRTLASEACKAGHVQILGQAIKPSREIRANEVIAIKIGIMTKTLKVVGVIDKRVGAKLVPQHAEDQTPASEYEKLKEQSQQPVFVRPAGFGRPTKKERRAIGRLFPES